MAFNHSAPNPDQKAPSIQVGVIRELTPISENRQGSFPSGGCLLDLAPVPAVVIENNDLSASDSDPSRVRLGTRLLGQKPAEPIETVDDSYSGVLPFCQTNFDLDPPVELRPPKG